MRATDGRAFYFNSGYIATLDFAQTQFVLAHEAMHCALAHFDRRHHRSVRRWDIAADYAVNLLLIDDGLRPPPGALLNVEFRGLSAEEIYPLIPPDAEEATLDRHIFTEAATPREAGGAGGLTESGRGDRRAAEAQGRDREGDDWRHPGAAQGRGGYAVAGAREAAAGQAR